jgi:hypothetical protein
MNERCLHFQVKQRRLSPNLEKFSIRTAYQGKSFHLDIDRDPGLEHRSLTSTLRQFTTTKYPSFHTRILRAVKSFEDDLTNARIEAATAAPTDHLVMLEAVISAPWVDELRSSDPLVSAKLRGLKLRRQMLETSGGALTSEQAGEILGISRQAVDKLRASNQLLALTQGRRGYSYPSFQFDQGKTLNGLEDVLGKLSALDSWMQLNFFTSVHERLGGKTPIKALHDGLVEEVRSLASDYVEHYAGADPECCLLEIMRLCYRRTGRLRRISRCPSNCAPGDNRGPSLRRPRCARRAHQHRRGRSIGHRLVPHRTALVSSP